MLLLLFDVDNVWSGGANLAFIKLDGRPQNQRLVAKCGRNSSGLSSEYSFVSGFHLFWNRAHLVCVNINKVLPYNTVK